jgi:hypothetical protein
LEYDGFSHGNILLRIGSLEKLSSLIDTLIKAVRAGELNEQLNQSSKSPWPIPSRKVA